MKRFWLWLKRRLKPSEKSKKQESNIEEDTHNVYFPDTPISNYLLARSRLLKTDLCSEYYAHYDKLARDPDYKKRYEEACILPEGTKLVERSSTEGSSEPVANELCPCCGHRWCVFYSNLFFHRETFAGWDVHNQSRVSKNEE
jgi:hypothetical protein